MESRPLKWWIKISAWTVLILSCQSAATLLGRLYFNKGGNSKWLATLVQLVGFPILLPVYYIPSIITNHNQLNNNNNNNPASSWKLAGLYTFFGLTIAADCLLYTIGLNYLPVSTYSLICASQLAFNALFAFFLKAQKFTPCVFNSIFLLTTSSVLLVFHSDRGNKNHKTAAASVSSTYHYMIGFLCTVGASAGYGLILPLTQLAFHKIIYKTDDHDGGDSTTTTTTTNTSASCNKALIDLLFYQSFVASAAVTVGLFASGDWRKFRSEMEGYELGRLSYVMVLVSIALAWQFYSIGSLKLIIEVSSLFSNVISTLGLPIVPVLAVFIFGEEMDGTKVVALLLAIWGFLSYAYQCYVDDKKKKKKMMMSNGVEVDA